MAKSKVTIMNLALHKLGAGTIVSPTQNVKRAKSINDIYDEVLDQELSENPWGFAINRATLAETTDAPAWGYEYSFQLPTDPYCLRVLSLKEEIESGYKWVVEGRKLLTNAETARIRYIRRETDPQQYSTWFVECFTARLAAEAAFDITGSRTKEDRMWELYAAKVVKAEESDAFQGAGLEEDEVRDDDGSWLSVR